MRRKSERGVDETSPLERQVKIVDGKRKVESPQSAEAFREYYEMGAPIGGKRSLEKLARKIGKNRSLLTRWSSEWDWQERARQLDSQLSEAIAEDLRKGRMKAVRNHHILSDRLLARASKALETLDSESMSARDILSAIDLAVKLQRQALADVAVDGDKAGGTDKGNGGFTTIAELMMEAADEE